ncbi:MAG: hypothetical protein JRE14_17155 [Deltaproteobacteria bacterium]|nr:hypothetical protein [Deltaproteobacteria bacterium]
MTTPFTVVKNSLRTYGAGQVLYAAFECALGKIDLFPTLAAGMRFVELI